MKRILHAVVAAAALSAPEAALSQAFDITTFDPTSKGPWSEKGRTTLVVPKVANNSVKVDGALSAAEYGGFEGVTVTPGDNAWILDFPGDRAWDNAEDSSFTFWLAHDDNFLYVGVKTKDNVVNSDDPNGAFWKDDAIEIVVDALNDGFDNNTDNSKDRVGGHNYVNFEGRFSGWDDAANAKAGESWASAIDWKYGASGDIFGSGKAADGGWQMEVRFKKNQFEDPAAGNKLRNGYRMGFNIGLDDDDKTGPGTNGDKSRSQDLEIQYFWANRERRKGYNAEFLAGLTPDDLLSKNYLNGLELGIDSGGRLAHGGTGELFFAYDDNQKSSGKILFVTSNGASPLNADPALIALLRAKGYTVTVHQSGAPADEFRAAAAGQDLVLISETIGSTSVVDPVGNGAGVFSLHDTDIPVISFEAFMYDNAGWVKVADNWAETSGANDFDNWGNTGRSELVDTAIQDARDSLYIQKPSHPIAGGLTGKVKVYQPGYSFNFGKPSAEADVIASVQPDGSYPCLFVYEKGKKLADGSVAPNKRIGLFLGQVANPNANYATDYADLTEAGRTLLLNTVSYAIGKTTVPASIAIAPSGAGVVITYAGGTLQSADNVAGPYANESGASPLTIAQPAGKAKYFRVKP